jgi:hypothetical protein
VTDRIKLQSKQHKAESPLLGLNIQNLNSTVISSQMGNGLMAADYNATQQNLDFEKLNS